MRDTPALALTESKGVDLICAQGGEGGGHTGSIPTMLLIPAVVDLCKGKKSPMTGKPIQVVAAGGIYNGRGLAAMLAMGEAQLSQFRRTR